jgi:sec-independent protein translocase protein TatA
MDFGTMAFLGTTEIALIAACVVLLFGATKIPQLLKGMGEGIREFRQASSYDANEVSTPTPAESASDEASTSATR